MFRSYLLTLTIFAFLIQSAHAQRSSLAWKRVQHIQRGINLSGWFAESNNYSIQQLRAYTTPSDLEHIRQLGFDHVRIPIDPTIFRCEGAWESCERIQMLDQVIKKALSLDLAVIVDFHADPQYTHQLATSEQADDQFFRLWAKIADHYSAMGEDRIFLEVMNEFGIPDAYRWNGLLSKAIQVIRHNAPTTTIIVSGADFSDIWDLVQLPVLSDTNLIYDFHFYEPHIFTHQGASWGLEWWKDLHNIPFPATTDTISDAMDKEEDEAVRWKLLQYGSEHWDGQRIEDDIRFAANWANNRNVPLICDEFGVYRNFSNPDDRERWIMAARSAFEKLHIGWTMWDYQGGFGVVYKDHGGLRDDDVALRSLGLKK